MGLKENLGVISVLVGCAGFAPYFWNIFKKRTKPHVLTWLVWTMTAGIIFFAQLKNNAGPGVWAMAFSVMACSAVVVLAFMWGEKDVTKSDIVAFVVALLAVLLWYLTGQALLAVILSVVIEFLSFYPTFRKSYKKPHQETVSLYVMDSLRYFFALMALKEFSLVNALYPITVIMTNMTFTSMVLWRRRVAFRYSS